MLLKLENIGMIKEASVKLDGLTIIAGENDTGKTTFAKVVYYFINYFLIEFIEYLKNNETININKQSTRYESVFGAKNSIIMDNSILEYNFEEKKLVISPKNLQIINDRTSEELLLEENFLLLKSKSDNVCFIDTPDILAKAKYIKNANLLMYQNNLRFFIPHQVSDLILRLSQDIITNKNNELYKKISSIIHGEVYYDSDRDDFYFKKDNLNKEINIHSTSNGIKMFGFLQILIANESIKENSFLILDEPEVHLHPKWQLEYVKIIIELVKNNVKVLINSHSPYMIEALKVYSDKENLEGKTNFYLAESEDGVSSTIKDVTSDLSIVFEKLTEPLEELNNYSFES